jgi:acyl-CoA synthetase (AMP-forming)/AMP-acid ligase II
MYDQAAHYGDKTLYRFIKLNQKSVDTLSYVQLATSVNNIARYLLKVTRTAKANIQEGDRVILALPAGLPYVIAFYA